MTKSNRSPDEKPGRRNFFRTLGLGAGAGVAAIATAVPDAAAQAESPADRRKTRYKADSEHVKTFYRVNRYPQSR
jgi:hypothetical protein